MLTPRAREQKELIMPERSAVLKEQAFPKSMSEQVYVQRQTFGGRPYIGARVYFLADGGDWRPTQKGLTLRPDLAAQVAKAMLAMLTADEKEAVEGN